MVLMNSGELYHWGYGGHGQTGDGSTSNRVMQQELVVQIQMFTCCINVQHTYLKMLELKKMFHIKLARL